MPLKVTNAGEIILLGWLMKTSGTNLTLSLFKNDYTPVDNSLISNFTESTFGGYSNRSLVRATWNTPTTDAAGKASIAYATDLVWTATSNETVYGYYCVDTSGALVFAERFAAPRALVDGDTLTLKPVFTLRSEA